jgi:hypothetical protein
MFDTPDELAKLWMFGNASLADYFDGLPAELGRDTSHCSMALAPFAMYCLTMENAGYGDHTTDEVTGVEAMLERAEATATTWAGYEAEAVDVAWSNYGGNYTNLQNSSWLPTGKYLGGVSWADRNLGTKSGPPNFTHGGAAADFGSFYLDAWLCQRHGRSVPNLQRLTERCRVTHASNPRSATNMAGTANPQYGNQQVLPALMFSPV